jgi:hypothetical protein
MAEIIVHLYKILLPALLLLVLDLYREDEVGDIE